MLGKLGHRSDEELEIRVDRFSIQSGNWQQDPADIRVIQEAPRRGQRGRGSLFIVFEPVQGREATRALYDEIAGVLADTYHGLSGSLTRGLRTGVLAANELLFERNLRAERQQHVAIGITCAVLRDEEVYVAQLGPGLVTHIHEGAVARYPARSPWLLGPSLSSSDLNREPPAGLRREVEPNLFHVALSPGDALLLSTTALAHLTTEGELARAAARVGGGRLRDAVEALVQGRDVSMAIIERPSEPTAELAQPVVSGHDAPAPSEADTARVAAATPEEPEAPPRVWGRRRRAPAVETSVVELAEPPLHAEGPTAPPTPPWEAATSGEAEAALLDEDVLEPSRRELDLKALGARLRLGARRFGAGLTEALLRVLPERVPERPRAGAERSVADDLVADDLVADTESLSLSGQALVLLALVVPLLMLFLVVMARVQYDRLQRQQIVEYQNRAREQYDIAMKTDNVAQKRLQLATALATLEDGLAMDPYNEAMGDLQRRISHSLDDLDVVTRFYHLWRLADLSEIIGGAIQQGSSDASARAQAGRIVIQGIDVYVLTRATDHVLRFLLNDVGDALQSANTKAILMQRGDLYAGQRLGDLVDIAWLEEGGQRSESSFVALERTGSLLTYTPQKGITVLPVADSGMWLSPQAIVGYYGNLYVLDPLLGRILKYTPEDDAYTSPPTDYVDLRLNVDLTGALDMTVDGNIYVLFADGKILKFFNGEPRPFDTRSLPSPMRNPSTIFVSGPKEPEANGYVYVTDTGNDRILQFDKSGAFVRQFKDRIGEARLVDLRAVYVDEETHRMFILSGNTLWLASLPLLTGS